MATLFAPHNKVLKYYLNVHMRWMVSRKSYFDLTPFFTPKGQMGKFLYSRLLAMYVTCEVHEKRRCAICRSVDIVIYVCTYPKCRFDL